MTAAEFADRVVGVPWVRWRNDWEGLDCWGLVTLFFRLVHGVDLGPVPQTDIGSGYSVAHHDWPECEAGDPRAAVFMAWRDGQPKHCGIVLPGGMLLHAEGDEDHGGSVRITRLAALRRLYPDLRFHRYAGARLC